MPPLHLLVLHLPCSKFDNANYNAKKQSLVITGIHKRHNQQILYSIVYSVYCLLPMVVDQAKWFRREVTLTEWVIAIDPQIPWRKFVKVSRGWLQLVAQNDQHQTCFLEADTCTLWGCPHSTSSPLHSRESKGPMRHLQQRHLRSRQWWNQAA